MQPQTNQSQTKSDVYSIVNNRIIEQLEKGCVPWKQPWTNATYPRNMITLRPYRGLNVLLLAAMGYANNWFLTLKQINELGGRVKKGEHAIPIVFWSVKEGAEEENGEKEKKRILRYYSVFNIEQCIDIPENRIPLLQENNNDPIKNCEDVIENMPLRPQIKHKGQDAYYNPTLDFINMPKLRTFNSSESYYQCLFHEIIHSTGHATRLSRDAIVNPNNYGSDKYSEEELVAQIGACFLSSITGCSMKDFENDVAYIQGWLNKLKGDKRLILFAASKAQRAVDFILDRLEENSADDKGENESK